MKFNLRTRHLFHSRPHTSSTHSSLCCSCAASDSASKVKLAICCEFSAMLRDRESHEPAAGHINKEARSLAKQIELSVAANRGTGIPFELHITGWGGDVKRFLTDHIWRRSNEKAEGMNPWGCILHEESVLEAFDTSSLIFLSPDSPAPLPLDQPLESDAVYCIGGIIDRSVQKGLTLNWATSHSVRTYRLPVEEAKAMEKGLEMGEGTARSPILNVSDVVTAMAFYQGVERDWVKALDRSIPQRKRKAT